jgi:hypothetical protein
MVCPYESALLGDLPGKQSDDSARKLRRSFIAEEVDVNDFLKKNGYGFLRTKDARRINQVQTYATASIVIEQIWEHIKNLPVEKLHEELKQKYGSPLHEYRTLNFIDVHLGLLEAIKRQVVAEAFDRHEKKIKKKEDDLLICFFAVGSRRSKTFRAPKHLKQGLNGLSFPSMADLVTIFGRIAHIAPTVFRRDLGREPSEEELFALLRQPYFMRLFVDMMKCDRKTLFPLLTLLEGSKRLDLNDTGRTFTADCFMVSTMKGDHVLHLRPEVIAGFRSALERAAHRRARRGKSTLGMLGCPALYTGKFREMSDWVIRCFEHWYKVAV